MKLINKFMENYNLFWSQCVVWKITPQLDNLGQTRCQIVVNAFFVKKERVVES